eukprot:TRINITY_DN20018_c0_g1::TRINITY_DN20018_c0_g1_i1::g.1282::m.1282 TRINITY_DN20018_c0_g1::TRINITY_DN20018_c0_g1_i1::g.1282  ORF type:complete len:192 (+),score=14.39,sp/Q7M3S9/RNGB_DICDI/26.62/1e-07,zf-C3HC4_3/PF13920.1/2.8e-13,zf-C3HC4_2/PF13923.1/7.2e-06,zf-RING_2/PF13639.1/0.00015,zf-RING_5/PF14634.1/0.0012,zinc_ribbon_2/PF13240.1/0.0035,Prok-RING_4/PF14447.1/0.0043,zf-P11/PF03854.9/0.071,Seryl_tRNA_N/PF02403.17/0.51,Seryl_tRNA_N/PF02403.17/32,TMF_DNA_bd/PF12329.3/3e+02,TMF_DNA_bd/PF12329.3/0.37
MESPQKTHPPPISSPAPSVSSSSRQEVDPASSQVEIVKLRSSLKEAKKIISKHIHEAAEKDKFIDKLQLELARVSSLLLDAEHTTREMQDHTSVLRMRVDELEGMMSQGGSPADIAKLEKAAKEKDRLQQELECRLCLSTRVEMMMRPCGHVCMCMKCAQEYVKNSNLCPICRRKVTRAIPAYI